MRTFYTVNLYKRSCLRIMNFSKRNMSGCLLKGPFWSFLQPCSQESSSYKAEQWCSGSESRYRDAFHFPCIFQSNTRGQQWGWVTLPFHFLGGGRGWPMLALWRSWSLLDLRSMSTLPSGTGQCWSHVGFFEPWAYDTFCGTGRAVT